MQVNSRGNSPIALHILLIQHKTLDSPADFFFPPNWRLNLSVKDKKKKKKTISFSNTCLLHLSVMNIMTNCRLARWLIKGGRQSRKRESVVSGFPHHQFYWEERCETILMLVFILSSVVKHESVVGRRLHINLSSTVINTLHSSSVGFIGAAFALLQAHSTAGRVVLASVSFK